MLFRSARSRKIGLNFPFLIFLEDMGEFIEVLHGTHESLDLKFTFVGLTLYSFTLEIWASLQVGLKFAEEVHERSFAILILALGLCGEFEAFD